MTKDLNLHMTKHSNSPLSNHRPIRSYVRREGRITLAQEQALANLWSKYGIQATANEFNFQEEFHQQAPLSIEIGFGNGEAMLHIAKLQPHINHLGIEVHRPGIGNLIRHTDKLKLNNVKVICADAVDILTNMVADKSIARFLIFFPDPWHKKRHHKRRLIQGEFVNLLATKLVSGGIVHLATDWQEYAEQMLAVMDSSDVFANSAGQGQFSNKPAYRPTTKFETRGKQLGHGVYDLVYKRR